MPQHLNLLDTSLQRQRDLPGSAAGLLALVATLCISGALTVGLHLKSSQAGVQAAAAEASLGALQARVAAAAGKPGSIPAAELARLRALESAQARVRAALDSGQVGGTQGYSPYLLALSRQMQGNLWLTDFSVAPDGRSIELGGRMTDPRELPDYLRRLNAEPLFRGREFAQLSLKGMASGGTSGGTSGATIGGANPGTQSADASSPSYTEFVLRSAPGGPAPR